MVVPFMLQLLWQDYTGLLLLVLRLIQVGDRRVKNGCIVFTSLPIMATILRLKDEAWGNARLIGRTLDRVAEKWHLRMSILP